MNAGFAPHEAGVIIPGPFHLRRARPVIGYALDRSGLSAFPPYDSELVSLHVLKEHQGQGFGQALIAEMAQSLQKRGCNSLMLWVLAENKPARALYE